MMVNERCRQWYEWDVAGQHQPPNVGVLALRY